jgi:hypothetical protein
MPNSVVVRGAASTGYSYITGKVSPQPLAADNAATRAQAVRHVSIDITNDVLVVTIAYGQNSPPVQVIGPLDLSKISGQPALPSTFKYGFAGSTFQTRTAVVSPDRIGMGSITVKRGEFAGDHGSFNGPLTYLPWYNCLTPAGVQYGRGIFNEGFLNP